MKILARQNRKHLWVVATIVFTQLIIPDFVGAWYIAVVRPQLLAAGARPCDARPALSPEYVPKYCDLVLESVSGTTKQQEYTDRDGRSTATVIWEGGHWSRTDTSRPALMLSLVFPALAFAALLFARRRPVIYLYAVPIIAVGAIVIALRT